MLTGCLITDSKLANAAVLRRMLPALKANLLHCWEAWAGYRPYWADDAPPNVVLWDDAPLPAWGDDGRRYCPIYVVDDESRNPDTLAVHYVQGNRPAARVYVKRSTGLFEGSAAVPELASHELVELLINGWIDRWVQMPGYASGTLVALENADPTQKHYVIRIDGIDWRVANFVHPAWFGLGAGEQMDHTGELQTPGQVGREGYVILRDRDWNVRFEFGAGYAGARELGAVGKPHGRTREILAKVAERRAKLVS